MNRANRENKENRITVRLNDYDYRIIRLMSKAHGVTVSKEIRMMISTITSMVKGKITEEDISKAEKEIGINENNE